MIGKLYQNRFVLRLFSCNTYDSSIFTLVVEHGGFPVSEKKLESKQSVSQLLFPMNVIYVALSSRRAY